MIIEYLIVQQEWNEEKKEWQDVVILTEDDVVDRMVFGENCSYDEMEIIIMRNHLSLIQANRKPGHTKVKIRIREFAPGYYDYNCKVKK